MKTNILLLALVFLFIVSCTINENEINSIENSSIIKSSVQENNLQIIKVIYPDQSTETERQRVRFDFFDKCYDSEGFSGSAYPSPIYFEVKMHDLNLADSDVEYWSITSCNTGRPGGILDGSVDVAFEYITD